ncbi:MAG: S1C family serine protease [Candidatus Dormibacteraceae bacterium]
MIEPQGPEPGSPPPTGTSRHRPPRMLATILIVVVLAAIVAAGVSEAVLRFQSRNNQQAVNLGSRVTITEESAITSVAATAAPAVVEILGHGAGVPPSSGFLVSSDGYIVTNVQSVVGDSNLTVILASGGRAHQARLVDYDCQSGVAVLKIDQVSNLPSLAFGDSDALKVGQTLVTLGGAGQTAALSHSAVSALHLFHVIDDPLAADQRIQVWDTFAGDLPTPSVASGGPVLNVGGQVVGLATRALASGQAADYIVAANDIAADVQQVLSTGQIVVPGLGAQVRSLSSNDLALSGGVGGAQITALTPGGPAAQAGLAVGDVITELDAQHLDDAHPIGALLRRDYKPGQLVAVTFSRSGSPRQAQLTLDSEHPVC